MNTNEPENKISRKHTEINLQESDTQRFWKYVDKRLDDACWTWNGHRDCLGYGKFQLRDFCALAHRVSWVIANGKIPPGLCVLHKCDKPFCQNPKHLFIGTDQDNVSDCIKKNRAVHQRGMDHGRAKLSDDDVREIRHKLKSGYQHRALAAEYNISKGSIWQISSGQQWKHVI